MTRKVNTKRIRALYARLQPGHDAANIKTMRALLALLFTHGEALCDAYDLKTVLKRKGWVR
jgi:hypothetical protein